MTGVAELNDNIYIVLRYYNKITIFGKPPSYHRLEEIVVKGMVDARDLVADFAKNRLFVADLNGHCVWRVDVDDEVRSRREYDDKENVNCDENVNYDKFCDIESKLWSISVSETGQVLVTDWDSGLLTVHSRDGERLEIIPLNDKGLKEPRRIIQTSCDTYVISYDDCIHLVDREWKVIKEYGGNPGQLVSPYHLADAAANDRKFVVDRKRIFILNARLGIERTLINRPPFYEHAQLTWWRRRVSYSGDGKRLIVSWGGSCVFVYAIQ